jgi:hypothetical protein
MKNFIEVTLYNFNEKILVNINYIVDIFPCDDHVIIKLFSLETIRKYEFLYIKETMEEIKEKLNQI